METTKGTFLGCTNGTTAERSLPHLEQSLEVFKRLRCTDIMGKAVPGGAKENYRGVFEIQKSGDKTSLGEIGLDIRTHASPKVGQDVCLITERLEAVPCCIY